MLAIIRLGRQADVLVPAQVGVVSAVREVEDEGDRDPDDEHVIVTGRRSWMIHSAPAIARIGVTG